VIVDASVVVKWFFPEPQAAEAQQLLSIAGSLTSPDLLPVEVGGALARRCRRREMRKPEVEASMQDLLLLGIHFTPSSALLTDALAIALAERQPMFDCLYLALARRSGRTLATFDRRLADLARQLGIPLWTPA
jgi:predicted nucleic acid-binding protein